MANKPRSPFFVPRPAEDQPWSKINIYSLLLMVTPPNQPPNLEWLGELICSPLIDYPVVWSWTPRRSIVLNVVPAQVGNQYFNYIDDWSMWSGNPISAAALYTPPPAPASSKPFVPYFWKF